MGGIVILVVRREIFFGFFGIGDKIDIFYDLSVWVILRKVLFVRL